MLFCAKNLTAAVRVVWDGAKEDKSCPAFDHIIQVVEEDWLRHYLATNRRFPTDRTILSMRSRSYLPPN